MAERASNPEGAVAGNGANGAHFETVRLKYCERCGALGIQRTGEPGMKAEAEEGCAWCRRSLQWLAMEVRR
jgi:hypothetical protein